MIIHNARKIRIVRTRLDLIQRANKSERIEILEKFRQTGPMIFVRRCGTRVCKNERLPVDYGLFCNVLSRSPIALYVYRCISDSVCNEILHGLCNLFHETLFLRNVHLASWYQKFNLVLLLIVDHRISWYLPPRDSLLIRILFVRFVACKFAANSHVIYREIIKLRLAACDFPIHC